MAEAVLVSVPDLRGVKEGGFFFFFEKFIFYFSEE